MNKDLVKLARIGSEETLTPPIASESSKVAGWPCSEALFQLLNEKNGFYAFESALHIFPLGNKEGTMGLESWNSPAAWRSSYGDLAKSLLFFGEDVFGNQFCLKQNGIGSFDAETGEVTHLASDLGEWAGLVLKDYQFHTGYPLAHAWQMANGPLKPGERLAPKQPFVTGGSYSIENLFAIDSTKSMRFRGELAVQIQSLPDGAQIKFKVI